MENKEKITVKEVPANIPTYQSFKAQLDKELTRAAESFVRIGWLLKIARDTKILYESGYDNLVDFAKVEYGLHKDQVSRFIAVHDRFSDGGEHLAEKYQEFGYAKLTEMLTLPDAVVENLDPKVTRSQIQEAKREIRDESKITDIEVILEGEDTRQKEYSLLDKFLDQYFWEHREAFKGVSDIVVRELDDSVQMLVADTIIRAMEPSGVGMQMVRIKGVGKLAMSFRGRNQNPVLINMRSEESQEVGWMEIAENLHELFAGQGGKDGWEAYYGQAFEEEKCGAPTGGTPKTETPPAEDGKVEEKTAESPIKYKADVDSAQNVAEQEEETAETSINTLADTDLHEDENVAADEPIKVAPVQQEEPEQQGIEQEESAGLEDEPDMEARKDSPERADAMEEYEARVEISLAAEHIAMTLKDFEEKDKIPEYVISSLESDKRTLDSNWEIWRKMVM